MCPINYVSGWLIMGFITVYPFCSQVPLETGALESAMNAVNSGVYGKLVDFDNHLDNISLDWRNPELEI